MKRNLGFLNAVSERTILKQHSFGYKTDFYLVIKEGKEFFFFFLW